ncbi:hypothetical protein [Pseudothauera rhizosphaerae]|uniref:Lipoprotein n=1 Tax=Pseudothauera rhizosphaerae TaxID=2565932 RepID=A0A4S4AW06_9RHOO|nr:hypothetical protein [Pseudothauera rhizosphaerae]THF63405.1 hypothetical protein E6O51_04935 [Pseudothauera rhizosphaerae]
MKYMHFTMLTVLLTACASSDKIVLNEEQVRLHAAETQEVIAFFKDRRILITDTGGREDEIGFVEIQSVQGGGYHVKYGGGFHAQLTNLVTECVGRSGDYPHLACKMYNGYNRWNRIDIRRMREDTIVRSSALIPSQRPIPVKAGDLSIHIQHSPISRRYAGQFASEK